MVERRDNDEEIVAHIRRSIRAEERKFWSLLIMVLTVSAIVLGILKFHLPMENAGIAALAALLVWIVIVYRNSGAVPPASSAYGEEILRKTIDDQHRRWRWLFVFVFVGIGSIAAAISSALLRSDASNPLIAVLTADLGFAAVFAAFQVCFGPGFLARAYRRALNDELTRTMQRSAAMFGYLFSVIAMSMAMGAGLIRPQWGLAALPGAIAAAVILPGLYFLILQWRAGRDG